MTDWIESARALWGDDWIAPLSEVIGANRRTVERWRASHGEPRQGTQDTLAMLARRSGQDARVMGAVLRRMAAGETAADIVTEINATKRSLIRIENHQLALAAMRRNGDWPPSEGGQ
jgi:hypothetical protein